MHSECTCALEIVFFGDYFIFTHCKYVVYHIDELVVIRATSHPVCTVCVLEIIKLETFFVLSVVSSER